MDILEYYAQTSTMTDAGDLVYLYQDLPQDISSLCKIIQDLFLHYADEDIYQFKIPNSRFKEMDARSVKNILTIIHANHPHSLLETPKIHNRSIGICRDISILLCSILRHRNIAARLRLYFANHYNPLIYLDGVCLEYWNPVSQKWQLVDAGTTESRIKYHDLQINYDLNDVPEGKFISAAKAWQLVRAKKMPANMFGSRKHRGLWYIRNRLLQELAFLNKKEVLIWDLWGMMLEFGERPWTVPDHQLPILDHLSHFLLENTYQVSHLINFDAENLNLKLDKQVTVYNPFLPEYVHYLNI